MNPLSDCHHAPPTPAGASRFTRPKCGQPAVFPEALDPRYQDDLPPRCWGSVALCWITVFAFLYLVAGWPKLGVPWRGGMVVGLVVLGVGIHRNTKP